MTHRILTGITTTGTPHLGNYVGAIRPAIAASRDANTDSFFFLADYHALVKCDDPIRVARSRLEIAATWLACGLDPTRVTLYRQSDIPEIPELTWLLTCVTSKGLLNRAHAYKAAVDQNTSRDEDPDAGITAGLYMYPVLMAADILAFNANKVPVGRDQVQHIEMARDVAQRFNRVYGKAWRGAGGEDEPFVLPEAATEESVATLPGLDGRKMSKSYDNAIPLFAGGAKALREAIARIVTDSREPGEPKDPDSSSLYAIFRAFASLDETATFRAGLESGLGWGEAKQKLGARIEQEIAPLRERYDALIAHPDDIEDALREGAKKARETAAPLLERLRATVGLTTFAAPSFRRGAGDERAADDRECSHDESKRARVVSFRDGDGFRFRLIGADGEELLLSRTFADPRSAGQASRALSAADAVNALVIHDDLHIAFLDDDAQSLAVGATFPDSAARDAAHARARSALASLRAAD